MSLYHHQQVQATRGGFSRRSFIRNVSLGALAAGTLSFHDLMSVSAEELRKQGRSMILLWMSGGPSQFETFDPKPGTSSAGDKQAIKTAVSGIEIAEDWKNTAKVMSDIALIRSMTNKEGNHQRATYQMHTGYVPSGSVKHPSLGSNIVREIGDRELDIPSIVSVGATEGAGFLGVDFEPFNINNPGNIPDNVAATVTAKRYQKRLGLLGRLDTEFASRGGEVVVKNHSKIYNKASSLVMSPQTKVFDLSQESAELRREYGENNFGKGCLLARRLVEAGSTFIEVRSNGWDNHADISETLSPRAQEVDAGMAALISDLKQRGMLDKTLVVWMGEFGRTPKINARAGRDHYPRVFSAALAGGGVKGGQVIGSSTKDGSAVQDRPVEVTDLFCSICQSLQVEPRKENMSPLGRPMKIVDGGKVVNELFS
ncbi:hypothetical protein Mal35_41890 [Gimesia maris]|jgi:hypothetical protein|uniref:DUF1501 domain-containing protein n=1 Tax=Gimesia maris TaxID=122 RepID=A0A3D3R1M2_9PLAN|nr:DUF1501 domain-containing protein [Gimesia maris]MAC51525.1 hypothetical protein [Gimesia sp.]QDT80715.1 hypothetical protein Mal35_41890 [Gimesia maris]HCO21982.1 DUF1501 domain-containing protein [Gimesia maris]|tara:strand:+ start:91613 stop:92893 length:1281 start_codon:yes stop_codon:yes gene_type:complete